MEIEEKVQRYDEALERARKLQETCDSTAVVGWCEYIFPELQESEDEKVRKEIVSIFHSLAEGKIPSPINYADIFTWLEKQGEQKEYTFKSIPRLLDMIEPTDRAKAYCQKLIDTLAKEGYNTDTKIVEEVLNGWNGENIPMAVMDEQKPTDKIEPKFKVKYAGNEYNVLDVKENMGITWYGIEDEPNHIDYIKADSCEIVSGYAIKENGSSYPTKPAMFSEQKPAWSEEDESWFKELELMALSFSNDVSYLKKFFDWLKSLKQRIGWKPSEEQIVVLELASKYERVFTPKQIDILIDLKEQLKKLKGE